jgi:hypothetical protein
LRCGVAEHLGSIVDDAVTVTIQDEPVLSNLPPGKIIFVGHPRGT